MNLYRIYSIIIFSFDYCCCRNHIAENGHERKEKQFFSISYRINSIQLAFKVILIENRQSSKLTCIQSWIFFTAMWMYKCVFLSVLLSLRYQEYIFCCCCYISISIELSLSISLSISFSINLKLHENNF